ncbi:hypothetical protein YC2023_041441 [Brassica napus]
MCLWTFGGGDNLYQPIGLSKASTQKRLWSLCHEQTGDGHTQKKDHQSSAISTKENLKKNPL